MIKIICVFLAFMLSCSVASALVGPPKLDGSLTSDLATTPVQAFVPDPAKSQVNSAMTGTLVFKKGTGGDVNITGWLMLNVDPTADATYYFNSDTTKTFPLRAGADNLIFIGQLASGESVSLVLGSATASVQGMKGR